MLPRAGVIYLVADGLGTSSRPSLGHRPWLEVIGPALQQMHPEALRCGFSYSLPGEHYGPASTNIFLLDQSFPLVARYAPALDAAQAITYVGFSLGGSLFALGLADCFAERTGSSPGFRLSTSVPALVLVQPALALAETYLAVARQLSDQQQQIPAPIEEFMSYGRVVQQTVVHALTALVADGVRVGMLYWPGDRFVTYPRPLLARLRSAGVLLAPLRIGSDPDANPFVEHSAIAAHPRTIRGLRLLLGQLRQP